MAASLAACLLGACTEGRVSPPSKASEVPSLAAPGQPNGEPKTVGLTRGRDTVTYRVMALDPQTHTFTVRIEAEGRPDLTIWFTTDYGTTLRVTSRSRRDSSCSQTRIDSECLFRFAELEAQHAGSWVIHIRKLSLEAATVTTTVLFEATAR